MYVAASGGLNSSNKGQRRRPGSACTFPGGKVTTRPTLYCCRSRRYTTRNPSSQAINAPSTSPRVATGSAAFATTSPASPIVASMS